MTQTWRMESIQRYIPVNLSYQGYVGNTNLMAKRKENNS